MAKELAARLDEIREDGDARAVVVAGAGSAFCAGADLEAVFGDSHEQPVGEMRDRLKRYYSSFLRILELRAPVIAAVQGPAVGAGLNLALACDIRLAGPGASFAATFSRLGLHPGGGCTWFLVKALGPQRALRLLLDGGTLDAEHAAAAGLADELVDDPLSSALALAHDIAAKDPALVRDIKRAVRLAHTESLEPSLEFESWAQAASARNPALLAGIERLRAGKRAGG
jgi:enoyl-CoA hydratase